MTLARFYQSRLDDDSSHLVKDKGDAGQKNEADQGLVKNRFRQFAEGQESNLRSDDRGGNRQQREPENVSAHAVLSNHQCRQQTRRWIPSLWQTSSSQVFRGQVVLGKMLGINSDLDNLFAP